MDCVRGCAALRCLPNNAFGEALGEDFGDLEDSFGENPPGPKSPSGGACSSAEARRIAPIFCADTFKTDALRVRVPVSSFGGAISPGREKFNFGSACSGPLCKKNV